MQMCLFLNVKISNVKQYEYNCVCRPVYFNFTFKSITFQVSCCPSCPAGVFENGQTEMEEEKEIEKTPEETSDQETQFPLDSGNVQVKNEHDSSTGKAAILNRSQVC